MELVARTAYVVAVLASFYVDQQVLVNADQQVLVAEIPLAMEV